MLDELFGSVSESHTRRAFLRTAGLAAGAAMLPFTSGLSADSATSHVRQLIARYIALSAGPSSSEADVLLRAIERARIDSSLCELPAGSAFHRSYAPEMVIVMDSVEVRLASGAYMRADRALFHDSIIPRLIKDLNLGEMRGSTFPAVVDKFGVVPFPCGERGILLAEDDYLKRVFEKTLGIYEQQYGTDLSYCSLDDVRYVRPAQTMKRIAEGKKAMPTFSVPSPTSKQNYTLLFGPEAMG